jgi:hypothetical protein
MMINVIKNASDREAFRHINPCHENRLKNPVFSRLRLATGNCEMFCNYWYLSLLSIGLSSKMASTL